MTTGLKSKLHIKHHLKTQKKLRIKKTPFTKGKHTSCYDVTVLLRYDVTGLELTVWPETWNHLAVTNNLK